MPSGSLALVYRNKSLRQRHADIPVRVLRTGKTRWTRGYAVWVSDVFAWPGSPAARQPGSPAAWSEDLFQVTAARVGVLEPEEMERLHRLGDDPAVATLSPDVGEPVRVAWQPNTARRCSVRMARRSAGADRQGF